MIFIEDNGTDYTVRTLQTENNTFDPPSKLIQTTTPLLYPTSYGLLSELFILFFNNLVHSSYKKQK